jgi:hypothetical protein
VRSSLLLGSSHKDHDTTSQSEFCLKCCNPLNKARATNIKPFVVSALNLLPVPQDESVKIFFPAERI